MMKQNLTNYINGSIGTSKYLAAKNIFCTNTGVFVVKKPWEEILGNILIQKFGKSEENNIV